MSITDELREWASVEVPYKYGHQLLAIADRIDAEHEKAMNRAGQLLADAESDRNCYYLNWQDCKQKVLQGNITFDELNARIESLEDELSHCIELPKDVDGEYIHIGDVMDGVDKYDSLKKVTGEVTTISFDATLDPDDSRSVGIRVWSDNHKSYHTAYLDPNASVYRHYHAPTVEDVLEEFVARWLDTHHDDLPSLKAEYAAKLRLAGDAE